MADDDDQEEFLDVEDPDSPGSPVTSETVQVIEGLRTGSKSSSLTSGNDRSPDKSVPSVVPGPEESKTRSTTSGSVKSNGSSIKKSRDSVEETSKSHEVIRRSQELPLSGKQSSLDRLSDKKDRTKMSKWQRQCNRQFRDMIGKREMKNEELERQQGDLRQRLNILECSMPAVMVWNIWRMTQGENAPCLQQVLEKQFQGPASGEVYCPASPSRHFDCRVREAEAERKQAQNRVEEARNLWAEKMASLEDREKRLQEARKLQEEQQKRIEQLTTEVQKLREARSTEDEGACEAGECGIIECRKKWLEKVPSSASIRSTDIECLEKLHELAEAELCMKRQIGDLERREQAYMRTLQQADELWNCLEGEAAGTIQEQLETKTQRITELEEELKYLRSKMETCREELEKHLSIGKIEALIGRDDDFASVRDTDASAAVSMRDEISGRGDGDDEIEKMTSRLSACREALAQYISAEELEAMIAENEGKEISSKLSACRDALAKYISAEELEAIVGGDDEKEMDSKLSAYKDASGKYITAEELEAIVGGDDEEEMDSKLSAYKDASGKYISAEELEAIVGGDDEKEMDSKLSAYKDASGKYISAEFAADGTAKGIEYKHMRPEHVDVEESTVMDAQKLLAQIGSLSELDGPGSFCAPYFDCNDLGLSETGLPEEERIALEEDRVTARELLDKYGLLEIAEQMGAKTPGGVIQYTVAEKYEVQMTQDVGAKMTRSEVEEVVEREIAYDEVASEHDGVEEHEVGAEEDKVRLQEDEVGVDEDKVRLQEDEVGVDEDEVRLQEDEVGVDEDEVGVQEDEVGVDEDEVRLQEDEVRLQEDEVGLQEDEIGAMENKVELMRDEVEEKHYIPPTKAESVLVPMDQLSSWQDRVHAVRLKISECPSCDTMDREAKIVADELAAYTGRTIELEARERIAKDKESLEIKEEMLEFAEEEDEMKLDRREDDKVDVKVKDDQVELVDVTVEEGIKREPVDEVESVEEERKLKEPEGVEEKEPVSAAEVKSEGPSELDELKPTVKEEVEEAEDAEEVPEIARIKEEAEDEEVENKEPEPAVKEELEEMPEMKPEIKVEEEEPEEIVSEEDEVEEVPVEQLEEFEVAVEVDIIPVEDESEPEEKEIEVDEVLIKEEPIEEAEVPEEIAPLEEELKPEEEGIKPKEIEAEEIPMEVVAEMKPEAIVGEEDEIEVDVIPKEERLTPEEETVVQIPVEEAEEEIKAEVPELESIELEVEVLGDAKEAEVDVEIEITAPVEVLKEKDEEVPEEPEVFEISIDEECTCDTFYDVEYLLPPVTEEVGEEESVCQCMAEDYPPEDTVVEPDDCQYSPEGPPDEIEEPAECQCMKEDLQSQAEVTPVKKEDSDVCRCTSKAPSEEKPPSVKTADSGVCTCKSKTPSEQKPPSVKKEDSGVCKCASTTPSEQKPPSVKKEDSGVCKCASKMPSEQKPPSVKKEDSGVCKCTSKTTSEQKPPSVKKEDSGVCKCTSKTTSEQKPPSVKKEDSGVCKCMSKTSSEQKPPSVKKDDSGVCKCMSKAPSEEKTPSVRKGDSDVCKCILQPPVEEVSCQCASQSKIEPTWKMPTQRDQSSLPPTVSVVHQKMEITQTSITQFEAQKATIQAVTQTVADVGMQAQPPLTQLRQQPKSTDAENLERLTRWKRSQAPSGATMVAVTSQTEKSSFLRILQSLKNTGVYSKLEPEKELRSIHYGKKSDDAEGRCNCCLCGKTVQDTLPGPKTAVSTHPDTPASSVVKLLQALPLMSKTGPGVDQGVQHESLCKECNVKRLQKSSKPQSPSMMEPKQVQTTNDQAISVCKTSLKGLTHSKSKKSDQAIMAMIKVQKSGKRRPPSEKSSPLKNQLEQKLEERKEDEDTMECVCSSMGTGMKKIRCACGDPD